MTTTDLCRTLIAMLRRLDNPAACDLCPVGDACAYIGCEAALLALVDAATTEPQEQPCQPQ